MRSRFSAFALGDEDYLLRSWAPATRPREVGLDPGTRWTVLEVVGTARGGLLDSDGEVEFVAHYRADGKRGEMRERSRFVRSDGAWVYLEALR